MKRLLLSVLVVLAVLGCTMQEGLTFEDISAPYLEELGEPIRVLTSTSGSGILVHWMWEDRMVTFGWDTSGIYESWEVVRDIDMGE